MAEERPVADAIRPIVMPKWGLAMQEGLVARWLIEEGAAIETGQEILDIETSKIANVLESPVAGPLRRIVAGEGETVPVGALLGVVAEAAVSDDAIEAFVGTFQETFAVQAEQAGESPPEPAILEAGRWRIRYLELGQDDGPPIVLVHGFGGDLNSFMFNQSELAASHRTIALDLPGHGGSTKDVGEGDIGVLAGALMAFADALGLGRAHWVGHSLGGAAVLDLALNHPERAASLTLLAPAGLGPEISMAFIDGFISAGRRKQMRPVLERLVHDPTLVSAEMVEDVLRFKRLDGVDQALNAIAGHAFAGGRQALELEGRLAELTVPAQVIWGSDDQVLPAHHAEGLPPAIPVHVFENTGHLVHMERAADVNRLILALAVS
jgi:pyruvate dehydrogenase E2 component (dihydrolipoamide acetyltransferase)